MDTCFCCGGTIREYADGSAMCDTCYLKICSDGVIDISDVDLMPEEKEQLKEMLWNEGFCNIHEWWQNTNNNIYTCIYRCADQRDVYNHAPSHIYRTDTTETDTIWKHDISVTFHKNTKKDLTKVKRGNIV